MFTVKRETPDSNPFITKPCVDIYKDGEIYAFKNEGEPVKIIKSVPVRERDTMIYLNQKRDWKVRCAMYNGDKRAEELYQKYTSQYDDGCTVMHYYTGKFALV